MKFDLNIYNVYVDVIHLVNVIKSHRGNKDCPATPAQYTFKLSRIAIDNETDTLPDINVDDIIDVNFCIEEDGINECINQEIELSIQVRRVELDKDNNELLITCDERIELYGETPPQSLC